MVQEILQPQLKISSTCLITSLDFYHQSYWNQKTYRMGSILKKISNIIPSGNKDKSPKIKEETIKLRETAAYIIYKIKKHKD